MPDDDRTNRIRINALHQEEGAYELASSRDMEPYLDFVMAVTQGKNPAAELEAIRGLPLEERYVWRVASALKWAFADCEDLAVEADRATLRAEDLHKIKELLKFRPMQLALFLKVLLGVNEMQRVMVEAIAVAKQQA